MLVGIGEMEEWEGRTPVNALAQIVMAHFFLVEKMAGFSLSSLSNSTY